MDCNPTPRAVIQRRYRARKSHRKVQVRWDVDPATLEEILRTADPGSARKSSVSKSAKVVLGREPINLQRVRLARVRYVPIVLQNYFGL